MSRITLYHGTPDRIVTLTYGGWNEKHDYGKGFYLTPDVDLAREWSVCRPDGKNGWVHKFELETDGLKILDFQMFGVLEWLAELMKHRDASDGRRYHVLSRLFIEKFGIDTDGYDCICGWRADASFFFIAKEFVRDNVDVSILEELLCPGNLGIQYCIKSEAAYANLREISDEIIPVPYTEFNVKYNERDAEARRRMRELVDSELNPVTRVFSTLVREE